MYLAGTYSTALGCTPSCRVADQLPRISMPMHLTGKQAAGPSLGFGGRLQCAATEAALAVEVELCKKEKDCITAGIALYVAKLDRSGERCMEENGPLLHRSRAVYGGGLSASTCLPLSASPCAQQPCAAPRRAQPRRTFKCRMATHSAALCIPDAQLGTGPLPRPGVCTVMLQLGVGYSLVFKLASATAWAAPANPSRRLHLYHHQSRQPQPFLNGVQ